MKYVKTWRALAGIAVAGIGCLASGYIGGHSSAMHQHASIGEQNKIMRDESGEINMRRYVIEAFKDFGRMQKDPLGLNKTLS